MKEYKGKWILWRWKDSESKTLSKNFVHDVILDKILEISETTWKTRYPTRILISEIEVHAVKEKE